MSHHFTNVPITANTFNILSNKQRVYLQVGINNILDTIQIRSRELDGAVGQIATLQANLFTWTVTAANDGQLCTLPLQIFGLTGLNGSCWMIEQFLPEDVLAEAIQNLARGDKLWPK